MINRFSDHLGPRLAALVDGELAHDDRDRALAHIAGCAACRTLVESERRLKRDLAAMAMPEPSARLMAALFQIPQTERPADPPPGPGPGVGEDRPQPRTASPLGGFLGRSSAFLPEFAVGLRPIGDPPGDGYPVPEPPQLDFRAGLPVDSVFGGPGRGLPTLR